MRLPFLSLELSLRICVPIAAGLLAVACLDTSRKAAGRFAAVWRLACAAFLVLCAWCVLLAAVRVCGISGVVIPDVCLPGVPAVIGLRIWLWGLLVLLAAILLWRADAAAGYGASAWRALAAASAAFATGTAFDAACDVVYVPSTITRVARVTIDVAVVAAIILFLTYERRAKRQGSTGSEAEGQPGSGTAPP